MSANAERRQKQRLMWMQDYLKIIPKNGPMCNLSPNIGQLMLWNSINRQRLAGVPVRIVLLKPRQVGWSTWSCAEAFTEAYFTQYFNSGLFSIDEDSTDHIFRMIRLFADELPGDVAKPLDNTNRKEVIFSAPHRSRMLAQTAGKKGAGHSYTFRYVHCSEVSRWDSAADTLSGIFQSVTNEAGTYCILESTANGMGGAFYEMFWEAVERVKKNPDNVRGFMPVFFPWFKFPEYKIEPYRGFSVTSEEAELKRIYDLGNSQILWRREKLQELKGDIGLFKESYPSTALEAFQASGNPVFSPDQLQYQKDRLQEDVRYVIFEQESGHVKPVDVDRQMNCWQLIRPKRDAEYSMGIDTREDSLSDQTDPKSKLDNDGAAVFNRTSREFDAVWKGQCESIDFARQCFLAAVWYNSAWIVPEIPKGITVLRYFVSKDYTNIYSRTRHEDRGTPEDTDTLGFRTDINTRRWLVDDFRTACHEQAIRVRAKWIYDEMETFVKDKTGKAVHMPGLHDDCLFAAFLAFQGDIRCPRESEAYYSDSFVSHAFTDIRYSGAVDADDGEELEDWNFTI